MLHDLNVGCVTEISCVTPITLNQNIYYTLNMLTYINVLLLICVLQRKIETLNKLKQKKIIVRKTDVYGRRILFTLHEHFVP
jgi:hypothetical protein